jgi:hypothetical protein
LSIASSGVAVQAVESSKRDERRTLCCPTETFSIALDCFSKEQVNWQSDVLRYEVLQQFGGFYVDADTLCLRSLEPLRATSFVASYQHYRNPMLKGTTRYDDKSVASGVLGSRANGGDGQCGGRHT